MIATARTAPAQPSFGVRRDVHSSTAIACSGSTDPKYFEAWHAEPRAKAGSLAPTDTHPYEEGSSEAEARLVLSRERSSGRGARVVQALLLFAGCVTKDKLRTKLSEVQNANPKCKEQRLQLASTAAVLL
jgi:hypothetical protein